MPTIKQKNTAKIKLESPNLNKSKLVEMGGYGHSVQKTPSKALESKGYKEALADYGLTEKLVTGALVKDIKAKPKKRYLELNLGAEILGMKKPQPQGNDKPEIHLHLHKDQKTINIITKAEDEIKKQLEEEIE